MSGLEKAQKTLSKMRENGEPIVSLNPLQKARENPHSRAAALKAKCFECVGGTLDDSPPNWRNEIRYCTSIMCPLVPVRPYQ